MASNPSTPYGFQLYSVNSESAPCELCCIPSADGTATFRGDLVSTTTSGGATAVGQGPTVHNVSQAVSAANSGAAIYGVLEGFQVFQDGTNAPGFNTLYRLASTAQYCIVRPANHHDLYRVKCYDVTATLTSAYIGSNADFYVSSGSTTTGLSGMSLNTAASAATTATFPLKIRKFVDVITNNIGVANQDVLVSLNNIEQAGGTGTVGV
jgi:hypothetical protein